MSRSHPRVLNTLERAGGFASAQEVYRRMQKEGESIGLTTVYRALQSLVAEKVVDVLRREDGEAIYRLCGETHHHHLRAVIHPLLFPRPDSAVRDTQ